MAKKYTASSISVLDGLEHVRKRPGMYIGGTDRGGLHHLVREIVDNSVDEAINGHASLIRVTLSSDGRTVTVEDNGRGIPIDIHPKVKKPALEVILTNLNAGAKFDSGSYITSGGLHGVGSSVVNALSERLVATVKRDGAAHRMQFRRGRTRGKLEQIGSARGTGTTIQFTPDPEIFGDQTFEPEIIFEHLDVSAYLNKGLRIHFTDNLSGKKHDIQHHGGVADFLAAQTRALQARPTTEQIFVLERKADPRLDIALCWTDAPRERFRSFVNGIPTNQGGTHEQGIKDALTKGIRNYIAVHAAAIPRGVKITSEDIREGVVAIGSVFLSEPQFQGQTKDKLNNPGVRGQIDALVRAELERWLQDNASQADAILSRIVMAARARQASREATTKVRRKSAVSR